MRRWVGTAIYSACVGKIEYQENFWQKSSVERERERSKME